MTFESYETSRSHGGPIDLYLFRYGPGPSDYYAYTDGEEAKTIAGIKYNPVPISRTAISSSGTLDKSELKVMAPQDSEVSELFLIYPPNQVVNMVIKQGHVEDQDSEFLVIWTGRVLASMRDDNETVFTCEPISTSMRRSGLRRHYQLACPHALYGKQCRASMAAATVSVATVAVSGTRITFADGWQPAARVPKYVGGIVRWTVEGRQELRTILRVENEKTLILTGLVRGLVAGQTVEVILGCNHEQDEDCILLHNNILNYGGQKWIPTKSPLGNNNNFY